LRAAPCLQSCQPGCLESCLLDKAPDEAGFTGILAVLHVEKRPDRDEPDRA